jgi:mannose/cellobiose epimerase-like protein (N-acyl-D-glucosamine 2-epimerase family)
LDATPLPGDQEQALRLRVWARQLYVFSHARQMGWTGGSDGERVMNQAFAWLTGHGWHPDGGFIHTTNRDGSPRDQRRDTYDHAFVLFALAHFTQATGRKDAADWFERTVDFVTTRLHDGKLGLYLEGLPATTPRRANPHMHLLEAWLAAYELTGDPAHMSRADAIVERFHDHFFDAETWTVTEFFDERWRPAPGELGRIAEPGHHYEWIWLLKRHAELRGDPAAHDAVCRKLFAFAEAFGRNHLTGMVFDAVSKDGRPVRDTSRCWPQTEALRALLVMERTGTVGLSPRIDETLAILLSRTLRDCPPGCWMDQYDASGRPIAHDIPASTLYHIFVAMNDVLGPNIHHWS